MLARFFIERPVLANVIACVTILLGFVALRVLPVAEHPPITPPTVQVTTTYPGASAKTLVETVALPIEQQVNGVEKMLYLQSNSTDDGRYTLTVTFQVGTDLDFAQVLVQNRVSAAMAQLPAAVQQQGVVTKKRETSPLQIITLTSADNRYDALFLGNFGTLQLRDPLARLPGVGDVVVFGIGEYSMRVWLDPNSLNQRALTPQDVINAIEQQNAYVAAGQLGMPPTPTGQAFQITANVPAALSDATEFGEIILKTTGAQITRLRDVGRVELGARSYSQVFKVDGKPAGGIAIYQLPGANALATAAGVRQLLTNLAPGFPAGLTYEIPFDTTIFVQQSVHEVYLTLFEAGALVLMVIVVFLQNSRATLVPATTVPVTIIGAFAAMAVMGFSVNLLTLFAVVLAIGIVVDDAIVVVEGVTQHIERGQPPKQASIAAMKELFGPIIGITLVLMSVFLPPAFMPGITGQMYRQFALVIAATALISAINAVTLKPTQCALWLRATDSNPHKNIFFRAFNAMYARVESAYVGVIRFVVQHSRSMVILAVILIGLAGWGFTRIPIGFLPTEDQGYLLVAVQVPDGAALERTEQVMDDIARIGLQTPGVQHAIAIGTGGPSPLDGDVSLANAGIVYLMLKNWDQRGVGEDLRSLYIQLSRRLASIEDARTRLLIPAPIQGLGASSGFQMQIQLTDGSTDYVRLQQVTDQIVREAASTAAVKDVFSAFRASVPQVSIKVDPNQTAVRNVNVGDVYNALQSYLGSTFVNLFTRFGHNYMVYIQADPQHRLKIEDIKNLFVRSQSGTMVPVGSVAAIQPAWGPSVISLYNLYPSATINGASADGFSSGQALDAMEALARRLLPPGMKFEWTGLAYQERLVGNSSYFLFALAILLVYFALAGQYESWVIPGAIILAVPLALLGTVGALLGLHLPNNLYVQIGLVLLIALSAKNAILIVERAREGVAAGQPIAAATIEASRVRFRPILMTSFTFILGVLPLVFATGAGAGARHSLGVAVASGMIASTGLAVLLVPAFFMVLQSWSKPRRVDPVNS
ncbi:MAG TPA: efflux RND transporter permease subunit [Verrucomicrobiota bacterium]|nr:hydrophobe/amphiphile efflux-1 family RND transporter [Verrucomicrobiales bacterium]HRI12472.1 efflux RND transporter permease subunit [Verrucomicrobiota bacterium]